MIRNISFLYFKLQHYIPFSQVLVSIRAAFINKVIPGMMDVIMIVNVLMLNQDNTGVQTGNCNQKIHACLGFHTG